MAKDSDDSLEIKIEDKKMQKKEVFMESEKKTTKRIPLSLETYKFFKMMVIDLELDDDGKISLEMIGEAIDISVAELITLRENKRD